MLDSDWEAEREEVIAEFVKLLRGPTGDGSIKRQTTNKPCWKTDPSHEQGIFHHIWDWKRGMLKDEDSGCHPLVHTAWRCLAKAWQEINEETV